MHYSPVDWETQQAAVEGIMAAPDRIFDLARKALGMKKK